MFITNRNIPLCVLILRDGQAKRSVFRRSRVSGIPLINPFSRYVTMTIKITRSELLEALRNMSPFLGETMSIRINEKNLEMFAYKDGNLLARIPCPFGKGMNRSNGTGSTWTSNSRATWIMVLCSGAGWTSSPIISMSIVRRGLPSKASALPPTRTNREFGGTPSPDF